MHSKQSVTREVVQTIISILKINILQINFFIIFLVILNYFVIIVIKEENFEI
jgi:hypothetical protein